MLGPDNAIWDAASWKGFAVAKEIEIGRASGCRVVA